MKTQTKAAIISTVIVLVGLVALGFEWHLAHLLTEHFGRATHTGVWWCMFGGFIGNLFLLVLVVSAVLIGTVLTLIWAEVFQWVEALLGPKPPIESM